MPTVTSELTGEPVDTWSEDWRHECECAWLIENKPNKVDKHLYLYGVRDREQLFRWSNATCKMELAEDWDKIITSKHKPLIKFRGLAAADRILADAKRIYEARQRKASEAA